MADIKLKQAHLTKQIESKEGEIKGWKNKAEKEETPADEKERFQARISLHQPKIEEWRQDLARCVEAIREQEGASLSQQRRRRRQPMRRREGLYPVGGAR